MYAHYDQAHRFLTLEMGRLADVVDTVDVPGGAAVLVDHTGSPVSIELVGASIATVDAPLRAVAERWATVSGDDVIAAARAALAAPDRDIRVGA